MSSLSLHPATLRLLKYQAAARWSRTWRGFCGTRRLALSILALVLAVVWVGQAALGLLLRQPADPQKLQVWVPLGLLAYALWHWLKTACSTPIEPFQWTEAEREFLGTAPLRRSELVMYRLTAIGLAGVAKAACFCLVMLPDLKIWPAGLVGMFLALIFIDLLRMATEIVAYGISPKTFRRFRVAVLAIAGTCVLSALVSSLCTPKVTIWAALPESLGILVGFMASLADLGTTWVGWVAQIPFRVFGSVILASDFSLAPAGFFLLAAAMVVGMMRTVVWLDEHFRQRRLAAERSQFGGLLARTMSGPEARRGTSRFVRTPHRFCGAGSLAWRQMLGALHYRTSLMISLIVPAVLSCLTLLKLQTDLSMVLELVGSLVFYSFLLLPTALKFDFRRDIDRLGVIKALPISPTAVTLGQLAVPVSISTLFQAAVLLVAMAVRPFHPGLFVLALIVLVPVNVLIFALENLIFMLYPYRLSQEGIGIFVRSILTFTAKGILFAIGLVVTVVWMLVSKHLGLRLVPQSDWAGPSMVFAGGMWLMTGSIAAATTILLIRVYRGFDPSQDTPAMS